MDAKRREYVSIFIITILILLMSGCANYGKLRVESQDVYNANTRYSEKMTIEKLLQNWQDYDIYYAGYKASQATGIMFDPKNDDRKLINGWWEKIDSKEKLDYVVKWVGFGAQKYYGNYLYKMIGPDQKLYGYVFTPYTQVVFKSVGDKTMYVYYLDDTTWGYWVH
jgi:uncharacterized protein YceK